MEKYIKLEKLGNGANSDVILVKNIQDKMLYALKRIFIEKEEKENSKILNEIKILQTLDHPNIIKYSEWFTYNKKFCIVMEYADKGDLNSFIKKHKSNSEIIKEETIWNFILQLFDAMIYIHSKKIIHRDIKSQNVFITKNIELKIGDFGISKTLDNTTDFSKSFLGTPYFLSPEICSGNEYNMKSDVWMVGCLIYECCTLNKPFTGETFHSLIKNIINDKYQEIPNYYSDSLRNLVMSMLEKDPNVRPNFKDLILNNKELELRYRKYTTKKVKSLGSGSFKEKKSQLLDFKENNDKLEYSQMNHKLEHLKIKNGEIHLNHTEETIMNNLSISSHHSNHESPLRIEKNSFSTKNYVKQEKTPVKTISRQTNSDNYISKKNQKNLLSAQNSNHKVVFSELFDSEKAFIKLSKKKEVKKMDFIPFQKVTNFKKIFKRKSDVSEISIDSTNITNFNENSQNITPVSVSKCKKVKFEGELSNEPKQNFRFTKQSLLDFLELKLGQELYNKLDSIVDFSNNFDLIIRNLNEKDSKIKECLGLYYKQTIKMINLFSKECKNDKELGNVIESEEKI